VKVSKPRFIIADPNSQPDRRDASWCFWYDQQIVKEQIIETLRWRANEVVLVHGLLHRNRHIHLARWPLRRD
jgi:hypothetical protein